MSRSVFLAFFVLIACAGSSEVFSVQTVPGRPKTVQQSTGQVSTGSTGPKRGKRVFRKSKAVKYAKSRRARKSSFASNKNRQEALRRKITKRSQTAKGIPGKLAPLVRPKTEDEFEGDVEKRREWFLDQRRFPYDSIPEDARRLAWESRPSDAGEMLSPGVLQWQAIGPAPTTSGFPSNWGVTSGRINAVAVSPANANLVLLGAATGGVWRSLDGGSTFAPVTDSQVDLAVGSIAFAPSNPAIVYAGMGDVGGGYLGTGVLRSTDSGATWTRISNNSLPPVGLTSRIVIHPTDPNRVYVAQYAGGASGGSVFSSGLWLSTDGGVNWTQRLVGLARDLVQHPTLPNILYATLERFDGGSPNTAGVWKSIDSGVTWARVYTSPISTSNIKVAVTPAAPTNVYVLVGNDSAARVEVSTNEGGVWTNRGGPIDSRQFG